MSKPQIPVDPLSGHLGHLSIPQQHNLDKLKKELQEEGKFVPERHDDAYLLRFLRARKFDLAAAKLMFVNCEEWRKTFGVDDLANFEFTEAVEVDKYYPQFYHKTDKDGRPLYVERLGNINVDQLYRITTKERLLKRLVSEYENFIKYRLPACSKEVGHEVETSCTILDLKGVGISQFYRVKDYVMEASTIGQNYYPESMGKFYIINAPFLFSGVWTLIKPWLDEVTVAKINILGSDYKGALLQQIPAENLPVDLGGTCKCVGGCSLSNDGPWKTPTSTTSAAAPAPAPTA